VTEEAFEAIKATLPVGRIAFTSAAVVIGVFGRYIV
jgi:hypothetical protein